MNCRKLSSKKIIILSEVVVLLKNDTKKKIITKSNYRKLALQCLSITYAHPNHGKAWINPSSRPTVAL